MPARPSAPSTDESREPLPDNPQLESTDREGDDTDRDRIARRAYDRFQARGGEHGRDMEDWFEAERELRGSRGE